MKDTNESLLSRREFARRAAVLSATATLAPAEAILPKSALGNAEPAAQTASLSAAGQAEADARYQQIISLYGNHLNDDQKSNIKRMCGELQPMVERVRTYKLENGDSPALYLKPLVEREKKPQATPKSEGKKS